MFIVTLINSVADIRPLEKVGVLCVPVAPRRI